jgi:dihydrofolate reductase
MRKVILSVNITMDGLMAGPNGELDWHYEYWSAEMAESSSAILSNIGTIIVGRVTYLALLQYWSQIAVSPLSSAADRYYAHLLCGIPKVVFSNTLTVVNRYQSSLVKGSLQEEVMALKRQPGKNIISWGGINMAYSLIKAGLVDVYLLWVAPVILNTGVPLFRETKEWDKLKLMKTQHFSNGVVLYYYEFIN